MAKQTHAAAPGKILWLGAYSLLEKPNVGFVTSIDAYVHAYVEELSDMRFEIYAPQLGASTSGKIDETGKLQINEANEPKDLNLLKTAIEVATRYVAASGVAVAGMKISTDNDPAFGYKMIDGKPDKGAIKSGLGSSAAVTVAAISAVLEHFGIDTMENDALLKLSQLSHSLATGSTGSGFDVTAAVHGSIAYSRYSPSILKDFPSNYTNQDLLNIVNSKWDYSIQPVQLPSMFRLCFANILEGSASSISASTASREFKKRDPKRYNEIMGGIDRETRRAVEAMKAINKGEDVEENLATFKDSFEKVRSLSKTLGELCGFPIEPDEYTKLIEETNSAGGFVTKLPGGGGLDSIAALCLDDRSAEKVRELWGGRKDLEVMSLSTTSGGYFANTGKAPALKSKR